MQHPGVHEFSKTNTEGIPAGGVEPAQASTAHGEAPTAQAERGPQENVSQPQMKNISAKENSTDLNQQPAEFQGQTFSRNLMEQRHGQGTSATNTDAGGRSAESMQSPQQEFATQYQEFSERQGTNIKAEHMSAEPLQVSREPPVSSSLVLPQVQGQSINTSGEHRPAGPLQAPQQVLLPPFPYIPQGMMMQLPGQPINVSSAQVTRNQAQQMSVEPSRMAHPASGLPFQYIPSPIQFVHLLPVHPYLFIPNVSNAAIPNLAAMPAAPTVNAPNLSTSTPFPGPPAVPYPYLFVPNGATAAYPTLPQRPSTAAPDVPKLATISAPADVKVKENIPPTSTPSLDAPAYTKDLLAGLTNPELKNILRRMGLKLSGTKSELIDRILSGPSEQSGSTSVPKPCFFCLSLPADSVKHRKFYDSCICGSCLSSSRSKKLNGTDCKIAFKMSEKELMALPHTVGTSGYYRTAICLFDHDTVAKAAIQKWGSLENVLSKRGDVAVTKN